MGERYAAPISPTTALRASRKQECICSAELGPFCCMLSVQRGLHLWQQLLACGFCMLACNLCYAQSMFDVALCAWQVYDASCAQAATCLQLDAAHLLATLPAQAEQNRLASQAPGMTSRLCCCHYVMTQLWGSCHARGQEGRGESEQEQQRNRWWVVCMYVYAPPPGKGGVAMMMSLWNIASQAERLELRRR